MTTSATQLDVVAPASWLPLARITTAREKFAPGGDVWAISTAGHKDLSCGSCSPGATTQAAT
jgi:hypothetical protein